MTYALLVDADRIPVIEFDQTQATRIINEMCRGRLLSEICVLDGMPDPVTVRRWSVEFPEFGSQFQAAVEVQAHMLFEEAVSLARNAQAKEVGIARLKVDVLLKAAGKLLPKVYGDKSDVSTVIPIQIVCNLGGDGTVQEKEYSVEVTDAGRVGVG